MLFLSFQPRREPFPSRRISNQHASLVFIMKPWDWWSRAEAISCCQDREVCGKVWGTLAPSQAARSQRRAKRVLTQRRPSSSLLCKMDIFTFAE